MKPPKKEVHVPDNAATRERDSEVDPYDFSDLNNKISKAISRLKDALVKTREAGRVTPDMVEALPVEVNVKGHDAHGAPPHKERLKIGDLASVTPKGGRMMQVFCAEQSACFHSLFFILFYGFLVFVVRCLLYDSRP